MTDTTNFAPQAQRTQPLYVRLAQLVGAYHGAAQQDNWDWVERHGDAAEALVRERMPSGSGFDAGTQLDLEASTDNELVLTTTFHHMNEQGTYDGWTEHTVRVRPHLAHGLTLGVSGRDRNDVKDYITEQFELALTAQVPY